MQYPSGRGRRPGPSFSQEQYRRRASRYDAELAPFEPIRAMAVEQLELHRGDTVLDVGCGTGLSFDALESRVGATGRVVGVEPCAEMLERAQLRVHDHHWDNVELVHAKAAASHLPAKADAALFFFTHDVVRDKPSLDHVLAHLKPGAHVVASGLQWAHPWLWPANLFVLAAALYSVSSLEGLGRPWDKLAARLRDVQLQTSLLGGIYIVKGRLA